MFSISDIIYYILFGTTLILSFVTSESSFRGVLFIRAVLIGGLVAELIVDWLDYFTKNPHQVYFFYIPYEFILLSLFFRKSTNHKFLKRLIYAILSIYIIFVIIISNSYYGIEDYPGIIYNTGAVFLIIWSGIQLLSLEVDPKVGLLRSPIFWFSTGIIIFYAGIFFYNVVYNHLLEENTELARKLRLIVNLNLNYLFYILLSYSMVCSLRLKRFSTP